MTTVFNLFILLKILGSDLKDFLKLRQLKRQAVEDAWVRSMATSKNCRIR